VNYELLVRGVGGVREVCKGCVTTLEKRQHRVQYKLVSHNDLFRKSVVLLYDKRFYTAPQSISRGLVYAHKFLSIRFLYLFTRH